MRLLTLLATFLWSFAALADVTIQPSQFAIPPGLVLAVDQNTPAVSPTQGQCWLVGASPTGAYVGHTNAVACRRSSDWAFYVPGSGGLVYNLGTGLEFRYDGSSWAALGVGASTTITASSVTDSSANGRTCLTGTAAQCRAATGSVIDVDVQRHSADLDSFVAGGIGHASVITRTGEASFDNETILGLLSTGLLKVTTSTGALSTATAGADYAGLAADQTFTGINAFTGVVNLNGPSVHLQRSGGAPYPFIYFDDLSASAPSGRWRMGTFLGEFDFQKNTDVTGNWGSVTNTLRCLQTDVCSFLAQPTVGSDNILTTSSTDAVSNKTFDALNAASTTAAMGTLTLTDAGATAGPFVTYFRDSASPAAADATGALTFSGRDSAANAQIYGQFRTTIDDPTDGSEDYTMWFSPIIAGSGVGTNVALAAGNGVQIGTKSLVTTAGALGLAKISASGSAPGASGMKIEAVCGTNSGTLKLVAYAGTSNTATTILDNIGSGVSGC